MSNPYACAATDLKALRAIAEEHGFCLAKRAFDADEMSVIGSGIRDVQARRADLVQSPALQAVITGRRIREIAETLLGPELVYYGEANVNYEESIGPQTLKPYNELHFDACGMPDDITDIWHSAEDHLFRGYRFGIYLQDYTRHSGSLKVAVGSHRGDPRRFAATHFDGETTFVAGRVKLRLPTTWYPLHNVPTEAGDIVVWNLRTLHAAGARALIDAPEASLHPSVEDSLHAKFPELFAPPPGPRNAMFFDIGAPAPEVDLYIKHRSLRLNASRAGQVSGWLFDEPGLRRSLEGAGFTLRFDGLIVWCCSMLALLQRKLSANPAGAEEILRTAKSFRARLWPLLVAHREFSPHFPLFSAEIFHQLAASDRRRAEDYAINAVMKAVGGMIPQTATAGVELVS